MTETYFTLSRWQSDVNTAAIWDHCSCFVYTHLAIVQDHDPAAAHHRVETMGDDEGGAAAKSRANGFLNETIGLRVDGCCCFIQYQNL